MNNEETDALQENLDFTRPSYTFVPNENHQWRQVGPYLRCLSCEIMHATYIGMEKIMIGLNEQGIPTFKKRNET